MRTAAAVLVAALVAGAGALAQEFFRGGDGRETDAYATSGNGPYDGRVVFVRLRYSSGFGGGFGGGFGRRGREPGWAHDYPTADIHLMKILGELTMARPRVDGSNVYSLSDPELHNYPIAYMSEPGFWTLDEKEAAGLRSYLLKGGFLIFDDFRGDDWHNLQDQMRLALPEAHWIQLDATHPVFHSFFEIDDLGYLTSYNGYPTYYGIFEGNDPGKRLMAIANRDNDLGEYWEYSDQGFVPVDLSNQAYKFGVNYFIYGLTH